MSKKTKITVSVVVAILVTIIAAFAIYVSYYAVGKKALPGTKVGEVTVSGLNASQIKKQLDTAEASNKVTFSGQGIKETSLTPKEIGYQVDSAETARKATARSSAFNYVSSLFTTRQVNIVHDLKPKVVDKWSQELPTETSKLQPVTEPQIEANSEATGFEITPGKDGFGADNRAILMAAAKVVSTQEDQKVSLKIGKNMPLAEQSWAKQLADDAEKLAKTKVTVKAGEKNIVATQQDRVSFVKIPDVTMNPKPGADGKVISNWVNENKESVEVEKVNGKRFVNSEGKVLKTETELKDGVKVTNADQLVKEIATNFAAGKDSSLAYKTDVDKATNEDKTIADGAEKLAYMAAPGEKWIDVNLSNYTVTGYEGATVVKGPTKMVPGAPATPTIQGTFAVERKVRSDTMRGFNTDGSRYVTPNVPYAMYFSGGYALHGAPWRGSFGWGGPGGSHGCVNMPVSAAGEFYNWAPVGTVVVSHR